MSSEAERRAYLKNHLPYEMLMLRYAAQTLPQRRLQLEWNMCVESFTVHARIIYEFLTNADNPQNFRARDYAPGFSAPKTDDTKSIFGRVHCQVLHLGKKRENDATRKIVMSDVEKTVRWIEPHFKSFLDSLDGTMRSCWDEGLATPPEEGLSIAVSDPTQSGFSYSISVSGSEQPSATNYFTSASTTGVKLP
jgi:hypothetical protein